MSDWWLGFDIGGTRIKSGVVDADGAVSRTEVAETDLQPFETVWRAMLDYADAARADRGSEGLRGVGIAAPGLVDPAFGVRNLPGKVPGIEDFPMRERLEASLGVPVRCVNDGAAALVVTAQAVASRLGQQPMARIVAQATSGIAPSLVMMAPKEAIEKVLNKAGWKREDVDLFEINEAFSVQLVALIRELNLEPAKVNVNGGAVALGHPIGASGARILTTLLHEMARRDVRRGIAALCLGGGNAVAMAVER